MRRFALIFFIMLAACGEWPDAGGPTMARDSDDWPTLLPLSEVTANAAFPVASDDDAARLAARAAALRNRARILRADAGDVDAMEALRARLRR